MLLVDASFESLVFSTSKLSLATDSLFSTTVSESSRFLLFTVRFASEGKVSQLIPESQLKLLTVLELELSTFPNALPSSTEELGTSLPLSEVTDCFSSSLTFVFPPDVFFVGTLESSLLSELVFVMFFTRRAASNFSQPSVLIFTTKIRSDISGLLKWSPIFSNSFSMITNIVFLAFKA